MFRGRFTNTTTVLLAALLLPMFSGCYAYIDKEKRDAIEQLPEQYRQLEEHDRQLRKKLNHVKSEGSEAASQAHK